jgi:hypothetical protein
MNYRDQDFDGQEVLLDGSIFTGCTFRNCRLVFKAMAPVGMSACHFKENVQWAFDGPAALAVEFMAAMYHGCGEGGRKLIEETFNEIRRGRPKDNPS